MITDTDRMKGCLLGLMCGDALGAPIEFKTSSELRQRYPHGIQGMVSGWGNTATRRAGDITDDSEMALALLRSLSQCPTYSAERTREAYVDWHNTAPGSEGITIARALTGTPSPASQANGALMRIAPLAIVSLLEPSLDWQEAAASDAAITHIHPKCAHANVIYVESLRLAMQGAQPQSIHQAALARAHQLGSDALRERLQWAATQEPDYQTHAGWLEIAFQAAYYHLLHSAPLASSLCAIVNQLGDPDTNGAIAGALLGASQGAGAIPRDWLDTLMQGSPERPARYRASHGLQLLQTLLTRPRHL